MSILIICNKKYKCEYEGNCHHRKPHTRGESRCDKECGGTSLLCYSGKMTSICVPISDKRYLTNEIKHCSCDNPKCNGAWVELTSHSIDEVPKRNL